MFERDAAPRRFAVIGLGRFGMEVVQTLAGRGHEVLAIDRLEGPVQRAKEIATYALQVDVIDEDLVREVGLDEVDVAVVAIGDDVEASIFVTTLLVEAKVPASIRTRKFAAPRADPGAGRGDTGHLPGARECECARTALTRPQCHRLLRAQRGDRDCAPHRAACVVWAHHG